MKVQWLFSGCLLHVRIDLTAYRILPAWNKTNDMILTRLHFLCVPILAVLFQRHQLLTILLHGSTKQLVTHRDELNYYKAKE